MRKIFKTINILLTIGLIFIAVGVAFIAFPQFGNKALIVRSGSMEPTIGVGSVIVARSIVNGTYSKGDIIAFRSEKNPETLITHRIVSVEKGPIDVSYKTKGDANEEVDGWIVKEKNVLGKTYIVIPYIGQILAFAKSDIGFPLLIILPAIFVILIEAFSIVREIKKRKRSFLNKLPFGFETFDIKNPSALLRVNKHNLIGFKILIPLLIFGLAIPSTLAFFSDSETSTGNVFQAADSFPQTSNLFVSNGFTCPGGASDTTTSKGTVTISKNGDLDVSVTLTGALPNTSYDLWVNQDPGSCPLSSPTSPAFITTDGSGNGSNTLNNHPLTGGATKFWVSMVGGSDVLRSTAVSF